MDNKNRRLILWANDSPLNAVDSVCDSIVSEIETHLSEAEEDSCFVNDVVAYVRCLSGVYDWVGGAFVEIEVLQSWRKRSTKVIKQMPDSMFENDAERSADLEFVNEVFDDLRRVVERNLQ